MEKEVPDYLAQADHSPNARSLANQKSAERDAHKDQTVPEKESKESIVSQIRSFFEKGMPDNAKVVLEIQKVMLDPFAHLLNQVKFVMYGIAIAATLLTGTATLSALWFGVKYADMPAKLNQVQQDIVKFNENKAKFESGMDVVKKDMVELQNGREQFLSMEKEIQRIAKEARYAVRQSDATRNHLMKLVQRIEFVRGTYMTRENRDHIRQTIDAYREYLQSLNIYPTLSVIQVEITDEVKGWPHYDPDQTRLILCPCSAQDKDLLCRFYTAHLLPKYSRLPAIRSGLEFYFPCSYRDSPRFAEFYARIPNAPRANRLKPRNLDYQHLFSEITVDWLPEDSGTVWAAAFWEIRCLLGRSVADRLISATARTYAPPLPPEPFDERGFVKELMNQAEAIDGGKSLQEVRDIFRRRGWNF